MLQGVIPGRMMQRPLLVSSLIEYGKDFHPNSEIVSRRVEGDLHRYTYAAAYRRVCQLAHGLVALGVTPGTRVATLAWNNHRHFELYYAIQGIGAVCHTVNPRLPVDQFKYVLNHADDRVLFTDLTFVPLLEARRADLPPGMKIVVMTDRAHMPDSGLPDLFCFEELLAGQAEHYDWPEFDENTACALCYTSGTTGNPKGALYSHRSMVLHSLFARNADLPCFTPRAKFLPVVPLFHVNAWGLPYLAPLSGAGMVMPGPGLDGPSLFKLMDDEAVSSAWGVPTVWLGLLAEMAQQGRKPKALAHVLVGGSAVPPSMLRTFQETYGISVVHGWGMTEMSPVGSLGILEPEMEALPQEEQLRLKAYQGRRMFGVDLKIVDEDGARLPHDGEAIGELAVRGPCVVDGYFNDEPASAAAIDDEGWFRTGDVASISPDGFLMIVDRTKDLVKSGGEWISSIDLENAAMAHPEIAECAVIAAAHPKWDERPLLIVVPAAGADLAKEAVIDFLTARVAKWWLPDDVVFVDELPHGATGKVSKLTLRAQFKDYVLPTA